MADFIYLPHESAGLGQNNGVSVKRDSFSVAFTVGAYGAAFGAASISAHFSILQTCLLSLLAFSGGSQFAVVGVIGAGGSALSGIATAGLLGSRNALYAIRMAPILNIRGLKRIVGAQLTIDESTGVALAQQDLLEMRKGFWYTGLGVFIFWNLFTVAGAFGAQALGDPAKWGLDAAVPAAFIGLIWPNLKSRSLYAIAALAAVLALSLAPLVPAGVPILSTSVLALIFGWRKKLEDQSPQVHS